MRRKRVSAPSSKAPWRRVPVYFGFDAFAGAVNRSDETIGTPDFVERYEFAPRVTVPYTSARGSVVTTSAAFRATRYGDSLNSAGLVSGASITRHTGEFTVDLVRRPSNAFSTALR